MVDDTESVYYSCLGEQNAYEKYLEFLRTNFPELYSKTDFIIDEIYENGLIWGLPMSGKSDASIASLYLLSFLGYLPLLLVQDSNAISQMEISINNFSKRWEKFSKGEAGVNSIRIKDINKLNKKGDIYPIHISIANNYRQPQKFWELVNSEQIKPKYVVLFDECHKTLFCDTEGAKLKETLEKLLSDSDKLIGTSATPMRNLMGSRYPTEWIVKLKPDIGYRDLTSLNFVDINKFVKKEGRVKDGELWRFVSWVEEQPKLVKETYKGLVKDELPRFIFISCVSMHKEQESIAERIFSERNSIVILHNSKHMSVFFPESFGIEDFYCGGKSYTSYGRVEIDLDTPLCQVIQLFSDWSDRVSHIYLVGSLCHNQGVRINSMDYNLAITDEFLRVNNATAMDTTTQKVRAVGYRNSEWPINIWCEEKVREDLIRNHQFTKDVIEKMDEELSTREMYNVYSLLKDRKINQGKVPKRKLAIKTKVKDMINLVSDFIDDDLNSNIQKYNNLMCRVQPDMDNDEKEVLRLTVMFRKWGGQLNSGGRTEKISRFMADLDPLGNDYSEFELKQKLKEAGIDSGINHITKYRYGNKGQGYGKIMVKKGMRYEMDSRLESVYVESFL